MISPRRPTFAQAVGLIDLVGRARKSAKKLFFPPKPWPRAIAKDNRSRPLLGDRRRPIRALMRRERDLSPALCSPATHGVCACAPPPPLHDCALAIRGTVPAPIPRSVRNAAKRIAQSI